MLVPQHWAQARRQHTEGRRTITVRRFGWSDASQDDAQALADRRAEDALARIRAGEILRRTEPKIPYNGADGVPIREEIVQRLGDTVITRNSYGARCLNTPDVLFADIDFRYSAGTGLTLLCVAFFIAAMYGAGKQTGSNGLVIGIAISALVGVPLLAHLLHRLRMMLLGGPEAHARKRVALFVETHPDWHLRLYRTPAGFRALAMHRTFDPADAEVAEFFAAIGTDRMYARMCLHQQCFRARVSPKPWRIGIPDHMRPRPGVWPVAPEAMPMRTAWIEAYEKTAAGYASCRFVETLGTGRECEAAREVMKAHDDMCRANSNLPMG